MPSSKKRSASGALAAPASEGAAAGATATAGPSKSNGAHASNKKAKLPSSATQAALQEHAIENSEQLIRFLLKSGKGGATLESKLQVAQAAWAVSSEELFVPKKAELLGDWVLSTLVGRANAAVKQVEEAAAAAGAKRKGKQKQADSAAAAEEAQYYALWALLSGICRDEADSILSTLASRHNILPLATHTLASIKAKQLSSPTSSTALRCLTQLFRDTPNIKSRASRGADFDQLTDLLFHAVAIELAVLQGDDDAAAAEMEQASELLQRLTELQDVAMQVWINGLDTAGQARKVSNAGMCICARKPLSDLAPTQVFRRVVEVELLHLSTLSRMSKSPRHDAFRQQASRVHTLAKLLLSRSILPTELLQQVLASRFAPNQSQAATAKDSASLPALLDALAALPREHHELFSQVLVWLTEQLRQKASEIHAVLTGTSGSSGARRAAKLSSADAEAAIRAVVLKQYLAPVYSKILKSPPSPLAVAALAEAIARVELYRAGTHDYSEGWGELFSGMLDDTLSRLLSTTQRSPQQPELLDAELADVRLIKSIWTIDTYMTADKLEPTLEAICLVTAPAGCSAVDLKSVDIRLRSLCEELLQQILQSVARTRALPDFLISLAVATAAAHARMVQRGAAPPLAYNQAKRSALYSFRSVQRLRHTIQTSLGSLQVTQAVNSAAARCRSAGEAFSAAAKAAGKGKSDEEKRQEKERCESILALELDLTAHVIAEVELAAQVADGVVSSVQAILAGEQHGMLSLFTGIDRNKWHAVYPDFACALFDLCQAAESMRARVQDQLSVQPDESELQRLDSLREALVEVLSGDHLADLDAAAIPRSVVARIDAALASISLSGVGSSAEKQALMSAVQHVSSLVDSSRAQGSHWDGCRDSIDGSIQHAEAMLNLLCLKHGALLNALLQPDELAPLCKSLLTVLGRTSADDLLREYVATIFQNAAFLELATFRTAILSFVSKSKDSSTSTILALARLPGAYLEGQWAQILTLSEQTSAATAKISDEAIAQIRLLQSSCIAHGAIPEAKSVAAWIDHGADGGRSFTACQTLLSAWCAHAAGARPEAAAQLREHLSAKASSKKASSRYRQLLMHFDSVLLDAAPAVARQLAKADSSAHSTSAQDIAQYLSSDQVALAHLDTLLCEAVLHYRQLTLVGQDVAIPAASLQTLAARVLQEAHAGKSPRAVASLLRLLHCLPQSSRSEVPATILYVEAYKLGLHGVEIEQAFTALAAAADLQSHENELAWAIGQAGKQDLATRLACHHVAGILLNHGPSGENMREKELLGFPADASVLTGTAALFRNYLTSYLSLISGTIKQSETPEISLITGNLREIVQSKTILLSHQHLELLFMVLGALVAPSHATSPSLPEDANIFLDIVAILSMMIRHRRDLVSAFLPHLAGLLARLIELLRVPYANLGSTQLASIQESMPRWLDAEASSLSELHARALARLLTGLNMRTQAMATRGRSGGDDDGSKVASLAKPFARHAISLLVAYIRALISSPIMFIPISSQRALEPGLFALCEITSSHDRDAALTGLLDQSGKGLLKRLWSSYERQRYKGQ